MVCNSEWCLDKTDPLNKEMPLYCDTLSDLQEDGQVFHRKIAHDIPLMVKVRNCGTPLSKEICRSRPEENGGVILCRFSLI